MVSLPTIALISQPTMPEDEVSSNQVRFQSGNQPPEPELEPKLRLELRGCSTTVWTGRSKLCILIRENGVRKFTEQCVGKASHAQTRRVPIPVTTPESGPSTALKMTVPSTTEEKICKKNDVKARNLLLMALPNEHQLTFNQYVDAQSMFVAIKARFRGNDATKKTQKALLKQQYETNATKLRIIGTLSLIGFKSCFSRLAFLGV
ncbi:hypothetical protein Tco_1320481 [Tanacetum coccineum]